MSAISFNAINHNRVDVRGWERAHAGMVCFGTVLMAMRTYLGPDWKEVAHTLVPNGDPESIEALLMVGREEISYKEHRVTPFHLGLNTAIMMGSNPVRLMARIHAQCEIHGYVEPEDAGWFADIIAQGLKDGVMRRSVRGRASGWEGVIEMARSDLDSPIVMSYSVEDDFPSREMLGIGDEFYDLDYGEQWWLCVEQLRESEEHMRIRPDSLGFRFGGGTTAIDLAAGLFEDSLK